ncbi:MAG: helix-hairpin-helix domain-containing protein [bacterium]|nr:helix-hairpin-helix domain-containing protein [bacterium]
MKLSHMGTQNSGMALVVTLLFLALLSMITTTFIANMNTDSKIVSNLDVDTSAKYIAKAGYYHALSVLKADGDFINADASFEDYDWRNDINPASSDDWGALFTGSDVDLAETITRSTGQISAGTPDARWIYLHAKPGDINSPVIGRYAVLIQDENARLNINTVGAQYDAVEATQQGAAVDEIDLEDLFEQLGTISNGLASTIVSSPLKPYSSIEDLYKISGIGQAQLEILGRYLSLNSSDHEMFYESSGIPDYYNPRIQMNYETRIDALAGDFFHHLLWSDPVKEILAAINLMDYRDSDHVPMSFSEEELAQDMNGDSTISSATVAYGVEGIQINEVLCDAWAEVEVTNASFITLASGTFTVGGTYAIGTSTDFTSIASATFEVPWENGVYTVNVYSHSEAPSDDIFCRVEGVGYDTVPSGSFKDFAITVSDGSITIEVEDPLQLESGVPAGTQIPSKFYKIEIKAGDYIEIVNISREPITLESGWQIVCDNGTPLVSADDRTYHLAADVTLNGVSYTSAVDPKTVSYNYLILTNSERALDIIFGTTVDGVWDGGGTVAIPLDSSNNPTFSLLDAGDDSIIIRDSAGSVIDVISANSPNTFSVEGYKIPGGLTVGISREKVSPDYDRIIGGAAVWQNASTPANTAGYTGTPGSANAGNNYYSTVKDSAVINPFFLYDMPKNEFINNPSSALISLNARLALVARRMGFVSYETLAEDYLRKTNWSLNNISGNNYLGLSSGAVSGSKITWKYNAGVSPVNDGEYRIFLEGLNSDEVHAVYGTYFDTGSNSIVSKQISTTFNDDRFACLNGVYASGKDDLLPFKVSQGLLVIQDNADPSTPVTENSLDRLVLQPSGFIPFIHGKINLNTADVYTLAAIPGVDSALASNIVNYSYGGAFTDLRELMSVSGMTFSQFCKMFNLVTVRSSGFQVIVRGQAIRDANNNGVFDDGDVVLGEKQCFASVVRTVEKNDNEQPSAITFLPRYFYWDE